MANLRPNKLLNTIGATALGLVAPFLPANYAVAQDSDTSDPAVTESTEESNPVRYIGVDPAVMDNSDMGDLLNLEAHVLAANIDNLDSDDDEGHNDYAFTPADRARVLDYGANHKSVDLLRHLTSDSYAGITQDVENLADIAARALFKAPEAAREAAKEALADRLGRDALRDAYNTVSSGNDLFPGHVRGAEGTSIDPPVDPETGDGTSTDGSADSEGTDNSDPVSERDYVAEFKDYLENTHENPDNRDFLEGEFMVEADSVRKQIVEDSRYRQSWIVTQAAELTAALGHEDYVDEFNDYLENAHENPNNRNFLKGEFSLESDAIRKRIVEEEDFRLQWIGDQVREYNEANASEEPTTRTYERSVARSSRVNSEIGLVGIVSDLRNQTSPGNLSGSVGLGYGLQTHDGIEHSLNLSSALAWKLGEDFSLFAQANGGLFGGEREGRDLKGLDSFDFSALLGGTLHLEDNASASIHALLDGTTIRYGNGAEETRGQYGLGFLADFTMPNVFGIKNDLYARFNGEILFGEFAGSVDSPSVTIPGIGVVPGVTTTREDALSYRLGIELGGAFANGVNFGIYTNFQDIQHTDVLGSQRADFRDYMLNVGLQLGGKFDLDDANLDLFVSAFIGGAYRRLENANSQEIGTFEFGLDAYLAVTENVGVTANFSYANHQADRNIYQPRGNSVQGQASRTDVGIGVGIEVRD